MRIVGGKAAGILLKVPRSSDVRPTTDRVKESLFGILEPLLDTVVVDLFAGSGSLGLEAMSRGAKAVYAIEQQRQFCQFIKTNARQVQRAMNDEGQIEIIQGDASRVVNRLSGVTPDIVLADPPYFPKANACPFEEMLADPAFQQWAGDALVVVERSKHNPLTNLDADKWRLVRHKTYGDTRLYFLQAVS